MYGSRAMGNYKPASDIDFVLKGNKLNIKILHNLSWTLDDLLLPYTFDLSIYNQIKNKDLIKHIEQIGKTFYIKPSLKDLIAIAL